MNSILVTYYSVSGSSKDAAHIIFLELQRQGLDATVCDIESIGSMEFFDTVIIGGPMRFGGFISPVRKFIGKNRDILRGKTIIFFVTCLYVIRSAGEPMPDIPVYVDPSLNMKEKPKKRMDIFDRKHLLTLYVNLMLKAAPGIRPAEIALFSGRLDMKKLGIVERVFMHIITGLTTRERVGDFLNPETIVSWVKGILFKY